MSRAAVVGIALLMVGGLGAFFLAGGGSVTTEPEPDLGAPYWQVGDHLHYTERITRVDRGAETTTYPTGDVDLHWHVVAVDDVVTIHTNRTWIGPDGHERTTWGQLDLDGVTPTTEVHPWIQFPLELGATWTTRNAPLLATSTQTTSRVTEVEESVALGRPSTVYTVHTERHEDGRLVRNDTYHYATAPRAIIDWHTQAWQTVDGIETSLVRTRTLEGKNLQPVPNVTGPVPDTDGLDIRNKQILKAPDDRWFFPVTWRPAPVHVFVVPAWSDDPWGLIDQTTWRIERRGHPDPPFDPEASAFFAQAGGQYRITLRLSGTDLDLTATHVVAVPIRDEARWDCEEDLFDDWCTGPTLQLPAGWERLDYTVQTFGDVRFLDENGDVLQESDGHAYHATKTDHPEASITPQWKAGSNPRLAQTVEATFDIRFSTDW